LLDNAAKRIERYRDHPSRQGQDEDVELLVGNERRQMIFRKSHPGILILREKHEANQERPEPSDRRRPARHQPLSLGVVSRETKPWKQPEIDEDKSSERHEKQAVVGDDVIEVGDDKWDAGGNNHQHSRKQGHRPSAPIGRRDLEGQARAV